MKVKTIGIVLEVREDADREKKEHQTIDHFYHWREPHEIAAIQQAIEKLGFATVIIGTPEVLVNALDKFKRKIDFIFNLSVGFISRFRMALAPSLYELARIPYSGADPYTKFISQNKHFMKSFMDKLEIPTPAWIYIHNARALDQWDFPKFPLIVKPAHEGSSIGVHERSVVSNREELYEQCNYILQNLKMPVIVEEFIVGKEYKIGYIGNEVKKFKGIIEDTREDGSPLMDRFYPFAQKKEGIYQKIARAIDQPDVFEVLKDCDKLYDILLPLDYGVFDVRVDQTGKHYFLEFNADATLHPDRALAQCCRSNGVAFNSMIEKILTSALQRWGLA
ncbi:MAG: D-alanine--D-alanine ligase [candidate division WOR-3 bacterium]|nr:D-alanine--D-alanine ligase [candidate division WOR-3 bacterium]